MLLQTLQSLWDALPDTVSESGVGSIWMQQLGRCTCSIAILGAPSAFPLLYDIVRGEDTYTLFHYALNDFQVEFLFSEYNTHIKRHTHRILECNTLLKQQG